MCVRSFSWLFFFVNFRLHCCCAESIRRGRGRVPTFYGGCFSRNGMRNCFEAFHPLSRTGTFCRRRRLVVVVFPITYRGGAISWWRNPIIAEFKFTANSISAGIFHNTNNAFSFFFHFLDTSLTGAGRSGGWSKDSGIHFPSICTARVFYRYSYVKMSIQVSRYVEFSCSTSPYARIVRQKYTCTCSKLGKF